ncbi:MAG: V-type ATP synthase subunit E [Desulfurococcales archaeon]|nr:V-type ATP synthase subunit E [Desulfurococcales archaeon]
MSTGTELETLRRSILEETRKKAEEILEEARRKAEAFIENAEKSWKKRYEDEYRKYIENARQEANTIIADAKRQAKLIVAKAKYDSITMVVDKVRELIAERQGFDLKKSLESLLDEALDNVLHGEKLTIYINPIDKDVMEGILKEKGLKYSIILDNNIDGGIIIETPDGIRIDNTYNTRLERVLGSELNKIAKILWGE